MYALLFLALILINATYGPSKWSLDHWIEKRFPWWANLAELKPEPRAGPVHPTSATVPPADA